MVKERTKKIIYFLLACCMILSVACISGAIKYNSDSKIASIVREKASFELDSLSLFAEEYEKVSAESHYEYQKNEYKKIISTRDVYCVGIAIFLVATAVLVISFFTATYPKMDDKEKSSLKRTIIKIGLVCAIMALIAFTILAFYSVDKLEHYEDLTELHESLYDSGYYDYYYDIKEYKAFCNKYELYIAISVIGICVSVATLLVSIILLSISIRHRKNIEAPKGAYSKLAELKKLVNEDVITQEEFEKKKEKILEEL